MSYICARISFINDFYDILDLKLAFAIYSTSGNVGVLRMYVFERIDTVNAHAIAWAELIYEDGQLLQPPD